MNSLERAKRFVASKASRLAIAVVPLAALAIAAPHAKANVVLSYGSDCNVTFGSGSCSTSQTSSSGGNPAMNWIALSGSGTPEYSGGYFLDFKASGSASGSLGPGTIPVSWDFNITGPSGSTVEWNVEFTLLTADTDDPGFIMSGSGVTGTTVQGSAVITVPSDETVDSYLMSLNTSGGSYYGITIPGDASLDFNPGTAVPEPSSLLVISAAGALIFLRRKRRTFK